MAAMEDAQEAAAPIEVPQATTNTDFRKLCAEQAGLCVLALLDAADPSLERQLGIVSNTGGRWKKQPLHFSWVDAARQVGVTSSVPLFLALCQRSLSSAFVCGVLCRPTSVRVLSFLLSFYLSEAHQPFSKVFTASDTCVVIIFVALLALAGCKVLLVAVFL